MERPLASDAQVPAHRARWLAALLLVCVAATWANALGGGFVWDDEQVVVGPATRGGAANLPRLLVSPDEVRPYYRPLTRASYVLDHAVWGLQPAGYHAVNVAIHAAAVLLLFLLGLELLGAPLPSFLAAALQAVHPVNAEAVNFLSARNNLLALAFSLAALLLFLRALRRGSMGLASLSAAALFLGLLGKEPALMAAPLLPGLLLWTGGVVPEERHRALRLLLPHGVALVVYLALRFTAVGGALSAESPLVGLGGRLVTSLLVVPQYLGLLAFPAGLTTFHREPVPSSLAWTGAALGWALLAVGTVWALRRGGPASKLGLAWAALAYVPIANLVPIPSTVMAERFLYQVLPGLWLIIADASGQIWRGAPRARTALAAGWAMALLLLAGRAVVRNLDWRDDVTLARSALAVDARSPLALYNLGVALKDRGDLGGAERAWRAALEADPRSAESLAQLGTLAAVRDDTAAAERHWRAALALKDVAGAHFNLAVLCERTGRAAEALGHYQSFLRVAGPTEEELVPRARARVAALRGAALPGAPAGEGGKR